MKQQKRLLWLSLTSLSIMPIMTIVACSNTNSDTGSDNQPVNPGTPSVGFQGTVDQWFKSNQLSFNFKAPVITEELFLANQTNLNQLKKAFTLDNQTGQALDFTITKAQIVDNKVLFDLQIKNQNQELAQQSVELLKSFTADKQTYVNQVYNAVGSNLQFKSEFANKKLAELLADVKSHDEIANWIIPEEFLGIKIQFLIPSQNINAASGFNVNYLLFDENGNQLNPNGSSANLGPKYVQLDAKLITPLTILFERDLNGKKALNDLGEYFGQTFLFTNQTNPATKSNLEINASFSGKHITGKLDFRNFSQITFESEARFDSNEITELLFDNETTINNLKSGLFTNNKLTTIILPRTVNQFNIGAFDAGSQVIGLEKQTFVKQFYDSTKKELFLNKLDSDEKITEAFEYVKKIQNNNNVSLNKIYLPAIQFNYNNTNVEVKEIVFNSAIAEPNKITKTETFTSNISNWKITSPIIIPESVILISKTLLPTGITINRNFNPAILSLIKADKSLELDQEVSLLNQENQKFILFDNVDKLDQLFYGFNTPNEKINTLENIIIKKPALSGTTILSNLYSFRQAIEFFKTSPAQNKTITISDQFTAINYDGFADLRKELKASSISIVRNKPSNFDFIDLQTNTLDLDKLNKNSLTSNVNNAYQFLFGFEDQIRTIQTNNVTKIKNNLFRNIEFEQQVTLDLSQITEVEAYAFYQTKNLNLNWPTTSALTKVGDYAFYATNANLSNNTLAKVAQIGNSAFSYSINNSALTELDLSAATTIGQSAFSSTTLKKIRLSNQLQTIENNAFSNAGLTELTLPSSITTINSYAFSNNNQLVSSNLDLTNVTTIGDGAFNNAGQISGIRFSNQLQAIGNYAFSNINLTKLNIPNSVTTIGNSAFATNKIASDSLDLTNVIVIGDSAFNSAGQIKTVVLNKTQQIGSSAFYNAGLTTLTLPATLTSIGQNAFANNNLTIVSGIKFDQVNLLNVFGSTTIQSTATNLNPPANYKNEIGFDQATKKLDLSQNNNLNPIKRTNWLTLLLKEQKEFNEVILPNTVDQNLIDLLTNGTTIHKLSWKTPGRRMTFTLSGKTAIKSLSNDFVEGMSEIPSNAFFGLNMSAMNDQTFSLNNVTKVGDSAFKNSGIKKFEKATSLKEIGSLAFDYDTTMTLGTEVKLQDNSFSSPNAKAASKVPVTVNRGEIFKRDSKYWEIYNKDTKVLDFTKAAINGKKFFSRDDWRDYLDIGQYLIDGDVKEIILPEIYVIWNGFVNNLGNVESVTFQSFNQQIYAGAFSGTRVQNKPEKSQTNIIVDDDNFFS